MHPNFDWNGLTMFKSLYWPFLSTILYCKNFHAFYLPTKLFRSDGWEGGLAAVHGHQPDRRAARHQPRHGVSTALLQNFRNFGNWETWNSTMTTLYCSRLIPSSCIHNLARWTERGAATEVLLSTSPPSWAYSAPSSPKVGCLLLSVCTGPLFIVGRLPVQRQQECSRHPHKMYWEWGSVKCHKHRRPSGSRSDCFIQSQHSIVLRSSCDWIL